MELSINADFNLNDNPKNNENTYWTYGILQNIYRKYERALQTITFFSMVRFIR